MRWLSLLFLCGLAITSTVRAAEGRVYKVLPQFLDTNGLQSLTPSLYDRDAYQVYLRKNPSKCSALRFAVQWKANTAQTEPLKIRLEVRGVAQASSIKEKTLEVNVRQKHWLSHWTSVILNEEDYKKFGEVTAWRVTLWDGEQLLGEQKSFLWTP